MENKPVWIGLDTEQIGDWIDSCPDWLTDALMGDSTYDEFEGDESIPDDVFDQAREYVLEHAADGRLNQAINECLYDTWLGEKFNDMVWDILMDYVREEAKAFRKQLEAE